MAFQGGYRSVRRVNDNSIAIRPLVGIASNLTLDIAQGFDGIERFETARLAFRVALTNSYR